jgi:hypothetical protein
MKRRKSWWALGLGAALLLGLGALGPTCTRCDPGGDDPDLVFDRTWMTPAPERETDYFHAFVVLRSQPIGAFYRASYFRLEQEIFEHQRDPGEGRLRMTFPQDGRRATVRYTVRACDELPPFELCIDLDRNPWGGPRRYYAYRDDDGEDEAAARHPGLARVLSLVSSLRGR